MIIPKGTFIAWVPLMGDILDIFCQKSLFPKTLASNCIFLCKMVFFWKFTRLKWSRDSPRPKLREIRSFKLQDVNVLQNSHFFRSKPLPYLVICRSNRGFQEPITRSRQLPYSPVTAFSQTDLFLVWIYLQFSSSQEPQCPIAVISTD